MMTDAASASPAVALRLLDNDIATTLFHLSAVHEDLQTVLRCCERLVSALKSVEDPPDDILMEGVWTAALLSYARCFTSGHVGATLTETDLAATKLKGDVLGWHKVLLTLREHYASPSVNPRELFSIGVAQDGEGAASFIAITGARQPLVEDLSVRQTGAIALALSDMVGGRITAEQERVFGRVKEMPRAELDKLRQLDVAQPD
ncbi:MAG TPA: hypothetical protein VLT34_14055 [Arthrobacter sp.]|nr:hypothetical protein [Arthrobacter sp.]